MEAIRNYLESMFLKLPNTPEVYKAKNELWQMMEDKYNELKSEGKSENEAVGIVISEFGNLDELAKDLGIAQIIQNTPYQAAKTLSLEEVKRYLSDYSKHATRVALGVVLCILSVCGPIFFDSISSGNSAGMEAIGTSLMFVLIAIAVGLFIYSGTTLSRWNYLKSDAYVTDFSTTEYLHEKLEGFKPAYALLLTVGIILCILSLIPVILLDALFNYNYFWSNFSACLMFFLIAIGVFMIVMGGIRLGSYKALLALNQRGTVGGNYTASQKNEPHYSNPTIAAIMSVYWPTVTCLYLCASFLTFDWHITWIVWPIAAIIASLIKNLNQN